MRVQVSWNRSQLVGGMALGLRGGHLAAMADEQTDLYGRWLLHEVFRESCPIIDTRGTFEAYSQGLSGNARRQVGKARRRLEREGKVELRVVEPVDESALTPGQRSASWAPRRGFGAGRRRLAASIRGRNEPQRLPAQASPIMPILSGITARGNVTWARPLTRQASSTGTRRLLCAIVLAAFGALLWPVSPASAAQLRLVKTIRTSAFAPPSPDPSGITYRPGRDRLIISDSEVDETGLYRGRNLFTASRAGTGYGSGSLLPFANKEPSGIGLNPRTATLFATNDDKDRFSRVVPGPDGAHGTGDDTVSNFNTSAFGSFDPEGVEYDPATRSLFICDGVGLEVYRVNPVNGRLISHFDLARYGARDCEGLGLDPRGTNSLLAVDWRTDTIYELGTGGVLIRRLRLSAIPTANSVVAGVTMAPTSNRNDRRSRLSYWIVDRHVDNNSRTPAPIDGLLYEMVVRTR